MTDSTIHEKCPRCGRTTEHSHLDEDRPEQFSTIHDPDGEDVIAALAAEHEREEREQAEYTATAAAAGYHALSLSCERGDHGGCQTAAACTCTCHGDRPSTIHDNCGHLRDGGVCIECAVPEPKPVSTIHEGQTALDGHTPLPWDIHQHNHKDGDLWLSIGHMGRGPIVDILHERTCIGAAELKYLATPEAEQWANARLIVTAVNAYPSLSARVEELERLNGELLTALRKIAYTWPPAGVGVIAWMTGIAVEAVEHSNGGN